MAMKKMWQMGGGFANDEEVDDETTTDIEVNHAMSFKSNKIRKLLLRVCMWEIYKKHFKDVNNGLMYEERISRGSEILSEIIFDKKYNKKLLKYVFQDIDEVTWEDVIINLRNFEEQNGVPQTLSTFESSFPTTKQKIEVVTSSDQFLETIVDYLDDPLTQASELLVERSLPSDELDYIRCVIQHEMVDLVRSGVDEQKEKLRRLQQRLSSIEGLILITETIAASHRKAAKEASSAAAMETQANEAFTPFQSRRSKNSIPNRTVQNFNNMIIDERRKLDDLEKKAISLRKKVGVLSSREEFRKDEEDPLADIKNRGRRVKADKDMIEAIQNFYPFENNDDRELDGLPISEREKQLLFRRAERDRNNLIEENQRLREQLGDDESRRLRNLDALDAENMNITSDLQAWEIERDELESTIQRLKDTKTALKEKITVVSPTKEQRFDRSWLL